jgi:hypothetical protein
MPRSSLERVVQQRLDEGAHASVRLCNLQIDFVNEETNTLISRLGGQWDRKAKDYTGDAPRSRVVRLHRGQWEFCEWFCNTWLPAHLNGWATDEEPIYTALVAGGRRGGKTYLLTALSVAYACAVPGAIVWVVVPSDVEGYGEELMQYVEQLMPREWYTQLGSPHWRYDLVNGSCIRFLSGFTAGKLKKGTANLVFINEAQQVPVSSYNTVRAPIADHGGLVIAAANPPDDGDKGEWVADVAAGSTNGTLKAAKSWFINPEDNPHIDHGALRALAESMSEHEYDTQILGKFLVSANAVLSSWNRVVNERIVPDIGECTTRFTKKFEGREYKHIVSIDVQSFPWIVASIAHAYSNPEAPGDLRSAFLWFTDEVFVDDGDEIDIADQLIEKGYHPNETLIICDASGDYQQAQRNKEMQRPEFKGKGSWDMLRSRGYRSIVGPDPDMAKNPIVTERIRAANARIGTKSRKAYVFADPKLCPRLVDTISKWRKVHGRPSRSSQYAHAGDTMTYLIWRFFPRRQQPGKPEFKVVGKRFEGVKRVKGYQ